MINVIPTSPSGVTYGIWALITLMQDNPDELMGLLKVTRTQRDQKGDTHQFAFIALFREKNSIGQLVAFINEWGTNWGPRAGGLGSTGYGQIMSFIADKEISVAEIDWDLIDDTQKERLYPNKSPYIRLKAWEEVIVDWFLSEGLPIEQTHYPLNDYWENLEGDGVWMQMLEK